MDLKRTVRCALPYITALAVFTAVCCIYFAPQFSGRVLRMGDVVQYEGAAKDIKDHRAQYGEDPQWTGNSFAGMPASLITMEYDSQIIKRAAPLMEYMRQPAWFILVAMCSFFLMLVLFGVNPWVGIVSALAYGLSTYFFIIIGVGHITKMIALAYAPLMIGAVFYALKRNKWLGSALAALFASVEIAANHPQITYYFAFIIAALWINELVRAVKEKLLPDLAKRTGLLLVAAALAFGSNFAPLWYINEYAKDSIRGGTELTALQDEEGHRRGEGLDLEYATAWSYGKVESFNMYIPYLYGGSSEGNFADDGPVAQSLRKYQARDLATHLPSYWGDQPGTSGPTYLGAAILFLAVLGLFMLRRRDTLWILIVSAVALMLAWGSNFMGFTKLFFYWFPGYDKFRTVAMILVIVEWTVPLLGAMALFRLWQNGGAAGPFGRLRTGALAPAGEWVMDRKQLLSAAKYTLVVLGGVALMFLLLGGVFFDFTSPSDHRMGLPEDVLAAMRDERAGMLRSDSLRSLAFVVLCGGAVMAYAFRRIGRGALVAMLAVLVCADLAVVNLRFLPQDKFVEESTTVIAATAADKQIMADTEPGFRVFNLTVSPFNDATTSYFHRSLGGYHGAKMQRYQDIIDMYLSRGDHNVVNMLNTRYFIVPDEQTQQAVAEYNPDAYGPAWFVETSRSVATADEEIMALSTTDLRREMIVNENSTELLTVVTTTADSTSYISLTEYRANYQKYDYYASDETLTVFSEIYYDKGWQAYVDGEPEDHFRVDYILRGMVLPEGNHTVEFRFRAKNFKVVSAVTLICSLLILASVLAAAIAAVMCKKKKSARAVGQD